MPEETVLVDGVEFPADAVEFREVDGKKQVVIQAAKISNDSFAKLMMKEVHRIQNRHDQS